MDAEWMGAAHFVILSGEKRRILKNGLSETGGLSRRIQGNAVSIEELDFIWIFIHSFVIIFLTY